MNMPASGAEVNVSKSQEHGADEDPLDGPQPMRDSKPAKTNPNSADHFRQTHEAEYEARGKPSTDDVERAQQHNAAYPVLKDQLDKRRSTARLSVARARREVYDENICCVCLKLRQRRMRKKMARARCQGRRNTRYKTREQHRPSRREVDKSRKRSHRYGRGNSSRQGETSPRESRNGNKPGSEVGSLKNPSTGDPSVSSYHSYPSMDHEPMIS